MARSARRPSFSWPSAALLICSALLCTMPAAAQTYPDRYIRVIMPLGPGGVGDVSCARSARR